MEREKVKYNRIENAIKGTISGIIAQIVNIIGPFLVRTAIIYILGVEYNGLNSLFSSILQVLNLAELGVGTALVYSMYKPIANNDTDKICALMQLYKVYYRFIGLIILLSGIIIMPFLRVLIKSDLPSDVNIYFLYLLSLASTVASYWLFAYKNSILSAFQKTYITNVICLAVNIIKYLFQILSLLQLKNYYVFLTLNILFQIINNIITSIVANRIYPQYSPRGTISKDERKHIQSKVLNLFAAKVCGVVTNSADAVVISAFLGLKILGIYNNYYYILSSIMATFAVVFGAIRAGIGNALITEDKEKNERDLLKMTCIVSLLINVSACCFLNLYQPFVKIWVGEDNMMEFTSVVMFCIYFIVYEYPIFWAVYKDASGKWKEDRTRSIVAPIFNTTVNIILVKLIGVNGVLISTILTYALISGPWLLINIHKYVIHINIKVYVLKILLYIVCIVVSLLLSYCICNVLSLSGYLQLLINLIISVISSFFVFTVFFAKSEEYKRLCSLIKNKIK